jgi:hypothetical protein
MSPPETVACTQDNKPLSGSSKRTSIPKHVQVRLQIASEYLTEIEKLLSDCVVVLADEFVNCDEHGCAHNHTVDETTQKPSPVLSTIISLLEALDEGPGETLRNLIEKHKQ